MSGAHEPAGPGRHREHLLGRDPLTGPTPPKEERRAPRRPDPRKAPHRGPGAAEGDDRMGSQPAQITGLRTALPHRREGERCPQGNGEIRKSKAAGQTAYYCLPTEGEVTRKWPEKRNGRSSRNALSRSSARSR